jgi:ISXO2 transposase-like protein/transposase-like zinc ribbon protein
MRLIDVTREFATEEQCLTYLEKARWPKGVRCVTCGCDRISKFERAGKTGKVQHLYQCLEPTCKQQFSAINGTIFGDTHLPLVKWFMAIAMMAQAKKGVSALQMQRHLGVAYKTAWHLCHRIRKAMEPNSGGFLNGHVEVDETYVGGKRDVRRKRAKFDKAPVIGMVERGGEVRAFAPGQKITAKLALSSIQENIAPTASVHTDDSGLYRALYKDFDHNVVRHSIKQYVRGNTHTQTIDGFWSLFKRRLIGTHHQVTVKHLHRYLNEAVYSYNNRDEADLFGKTIAALLIHATFRYATLKADPSEPQA